MDPKQTEGQNSGPGNAPAGGFSFSSEPANNTANNSGTLSTGANVARAMSDLNSNRKSATQNSPFAKHQFQKVAPRTGDILIDPSGNIITEEPKKGINRGRLIQFGLIFGGIALVALAIFTVVMVINNKPKDTTQTIVEKKADLPEYVSMLAGGDNEIDDIETTWSDYLSNYNSLYAVGLISDEPSEERTDYYERLNQRWNEYISQYDGEYSGDPSLIYVTEYFYDYALSKTLTEGEIYGILVDSNYDTESAKNQMKEQLLNDVNSLSISIIENIRLDYYDSIVDLMKEAKDADCLSEETYFRGCATSKLASYGKHQEAINALNTIPGRVQVLQTNAISTIYNLCEEAFDSSDEDTNNTAKGGV